MASNATVMAGRGPHTGQNPVLGIDGVVQTAAFADPFPDEARLVDARKWLRGKRSGPVGDLDEGVVSASARHATEGVVEHLADELACVVVGGLGGALHLLLSGEHLVRRDRGLTMGLRRRRSVIIWDGFGQTRRAFLPETAPNDH